MGRDTGANGSQPGSERGLHQLGIAGGQILKQALEDDAGVNEEVVGEGALFLVQEISFRSLIR